MDCRVEAGREVTRLFQLSRRETMDVWVGVVGNGVREKWIDLEYTVDP